jgi:AraC-like DNA-binding protein
VGVLPDGRMDLIWSAHRGVQIMGPQQRALGRPCRPQDVVVGVRFPPGILPPLLGIPAHQIADLHLSLAAIDSRPAFALRRDLTGIEDPTQALEVLTRAVARRLYASDGADPLVARAVAMLRHPGARVERVATALEISERQLERRFHHVVGYGPKTLYRIVRFQRMCAALARWGRQAGGVAAIAAAVGYADQSHLARECLALSGHTPANLVRALDLLKAHGASGIYKSGARKRAFVPNSAFTGRR